MDVFDFLDKAKTFLNADIKILEAMDGDQDVADVLDRLGVAVSALEDEQAPLRRCPPCIGDLGTHPGELILVVLGEECPLDREGPEERR